MKKRKTLYEVFNRGERAEPAPESAAPAPPRRRAKPASGERTKPAASPKARAKADLASVRARASSEPAPHPAGAGESHLLVPRRVAGIAALVVVALLAGSYYLGARNGGGGASRVPLLSRTGGDPPSESGGDTDENGTFWAVRVVTLPFHDPSASVRATNEARVKSIIRELKSRGFPEVHGRRRGDKAAIFVGRGVRKDDVEDLMKRIQQERYEGRLAFRDAFCFQLSKSER